jgi:ATP-dependent helicase/nuclease subunit A
MNPIIKECAGERCYHEQPFVMYVPAKDVFDNTNSTDKVLVQGVIDLLVDGKKKYIIDFKYSSLSSAEARERYKKQLNLYKMAYKVSFGNEIDKIVLLSLKNGESFEL